MPFRLTRGGVVRPAPQELAALRDEYRSRHCVMFPQLLEPALHQWASRRLADARWQRHVHEGIDPPAVDLILEDEILSGALNAIVNHPDVYEVVRGITECEPIAMYRFRVYRMDGDAGHTDSWHDDHDGDRLATLSVNLGIEPFEGGALDIRDRGTRRLIHHVHNTGRGDAILFRIDPSLEHRVEEVRGRVPKYAMAGWFQRHGRPW